MKRIMAGLMMAVMVLLSTTMAHAQGTSLSSNKKFRVVLVDGTSVKAWGGEIVVQGEVIVLRDAATGEQRSYRLSQVKGIYRGSHWAIGLGIGAGVGATAGALAGYFGGGSCSGSVDSECNSMRSLGAIVSGAGGLVVGAGIGAGIGAAIPRKANISIAPTVMSAPGRPVAGMGVGISGRF